MSQCADDEVPSWEKDDEELDVVEMLALAGRVEDLVWDVGEDEEAECTVEMVDPEEVRWVQAHERQAYPHRSNWWAAEKG